MDFLELVRGRESIRSYDPQRPVDRPVLERILEAGRLAPSAANRQPWRFLLVSAGPALVRVKDSYPRPWFQGAPHVLAATGNRSRAWVRSADGYNSLETDLAIAMTHMVLAAESEGVATCWIAAFDPAALREALGLNEKEIVLAITPLGYPRPGFARKRDKQRRPFDEVARFL